MGVIPKIYYHLDKTAKTITLLPPYDTLTPEKIVSIRNISKQVEIYNSRDPRKHTLFIKESDRTQDFDIEITNGILTYVEDAGMEDEDALRIIIDGDIEPVTVDLYSDAPLAANETIMSLGQSMTGVNQLSIYVYNTGASTSITINIYSSPDNDVDNIALLQPFTLSDTAKSGTVPVSVVPPFLFIQTINNTATATTYTVKFSKK